MEIKKKSGAAGKGEASRERIAKAALKRFAQEGFYQASIQSIADACKISQSAVLYHFPTKEHLVEDVIKRIVVHNHEIVSAGQKIEDNAYERLRKHFELNLSWAVDFVEEAQIIILLYYLACVDARFSALYETILGAARKRISEYLWAGKREKLFKDSLQVDAVAEILHDGLLGGVINTITQKNKKSLMKSVQEKWQKLLAETTGYEPTK